MIERRREERSERKGKEERMISGSTRRLRLRLGMEGTKEERDGTRKESIEKRKTKERGGGKESAEL